MDLEEVDLFRLDLNPFDLGKKHCNFTVTINPQLLEKYRKAKGWDQVVSPGWREDNTLRFCESFKSAYQLGSMIIERDQNGHVSAFIIRSRPNPLQSQEKEITEYRLVWDSREGKYFTENAQTLFHSAILFQLFFRKEMSLTITTLQLDKGRVPWWVTNFSISRPGISIETSPQFIRRAQKFLKEKSEFEREFNKLARDELQKHGLGIFSEELHPHFSATKKYFPLQFRVRSCGAGGATISNPYGNPDDRAERILKEGIRYSPHNVDHYNQDIALLLIFWLFDKMIREHYGVDFF